MASKAAKSTKSPHKARLYIVSTSIQSCMSSIESFLYKKYNYKPITIPLRYGIVYYKFKIKELGESKMDIAKLKSNANAKKFPSGTLITKEGDKEGNEMYVLLGGTVGVYKDYKGPKETKLAELGPGNFFGEMSLFLNRQRSVTVVAQGDVILLVLGQVAVYEFFEKEPELTYGLMKTLCHRLSEANTALSRGHLPSGLASGTPPEPLFSVLVPGKGAAAPAAPAPAAKPAPSAPIGDMPMMFSDNPTPEQMAAYMAQMNGGGAAAATSLSGLPADLFPEGHQMYDLAPQEKPKDLVYKKSFKCPICDKSFPAYAVRHTKLKSLDRSKDFRNVYDSIDTTYFEIVTCPECWFSNFEPAYAKPVISRFKESIPEITKYKAQLGIDLVEDRSINPVFAGYYLALKGAPLFYKEHEMTSAKIWLRLKWLYADVKDEAMEKMATQKAHEMYLIAFEKTDISPEALQQLNVLVGELSLMVKDIEKAQTFFTKARMHRGGSTALISQAEDGIDIVRKVKAGQMQL
jgi:CRP-like cAMP-binding protein/uncharacterized protein (DUF2225 family)